MKLRWLAQAEDNLADQISYIAERNPLAAVEMLDRVEAAVEQLAKFPRSGRAGRVAATRELPVTGTPFVVIYRIKESTLQILRVLHGAQRWPPEG